VFIDAVLFHGSIAQHVVLEPFCKLFIVDLEVEPYKAAPTEHPQEDAQEEKQVLVM